MEEFFAAEKVVRRDIETVYEGLFLRCMNAFESFLEDLFIEVMLERTSYSASVVSTRIIATSRGAVWDVLLQGDDYLEWLPFGRTEKRANVFLNKGRPFTVLDDGDRSKLKQFMIIRNAIAHRSTFAQRQFFEKVVGTLSLPPRERTPAGYLRSIARISPRFVRYEICASDLAMIASKITTGR